MGCHYFLYTFYRFPTTNRHTFLAYHNSTTMRSFGTEISGNRPRQAELSETTRTQIIYAIQNGEKPAQIARKFEVAR